MAKLIVYASKTGTTEKCTNIIAKEIKDVTIVNLEKQNVDISKYDMIIIGTPIRMGMIHKKIKKFINDNFELLKTKKVAYFICCGFNENWKQYYEQNISKELLDKSIIYTTFGGEMDLEKQRGFDKFIVKMVSKNIDGNKKIELVENNIEQFINEITKIDKNIGK